MANMPNSIKYIVQSKSVNLSIGDGVDIEVDKSHYANTWRIDTVIVVKYRFYILSHYLTLYTYILPNLFGVRLLADIAEVLDVNMEEIRPAKCLNRKIIGSMNNMKEIIEKFMRRSQGGEMIEIQEFVNRTPFSYLDWGMPDKCWDKFNKTGKA